MPAMCAGVGVHSGARARVLLSPAPANTGIVFVRTDLVEVDNRIPASISAVTTTQLGTTLTNAAGATVATTEHLMAACAGLGVDNLLVEIDGPELPILDGSSAGFVQILQQAGLRAQRATVRVLRILEPVTVRCGAKSASLLPTGGDDFELDVTIRFSDAAIGVQQKRLTLTPESFASELADARTFGFMADVKMLHAQGLGRGASMDNTVAVEAGKVLNPEGLRFEDEFVRHKMLDAVGDLALLGAPIAGRFVADQPGHALNALLARALMDTQGAWRWDAEEAPLLAHAGA